VPLPATAIKQQTTSGGVVGLIALLTADGSSVMKSKQTELMPITNVTNGRALSGAQDGTRFSRDRSCW
jgi:hypothetical protein